MTQKRLIFLSEINYIKRAGRSYRDNWEMAKQRTQVQFPAPIQHLNNDL